MKSTGAVLVELHGAQFMRRAVGCWSRGAALVAFMALVGCATKGFVKSFVDPGYVQGGITSIAVFPVRNAGRAPAEAREVNIALSRALLAKNSSLRVVSSADCVRLINDAGLAQDWNRFVDGLLAGGIPDRPALERIGAALGVNAIMQAQVASVVQADGDGFTTVATTRATLTCAVYEVATAKLIWEAAADGIKRKGRRAAPPVSDAIDSAMKLVVQNVPVF